MLHRRFFILFVIGTIGLTACALGQTEKKTGASVPAKEESKIDPDDLKTIKEAGLPPNDPSALLDFFRDRTLAENDRTKIEALIQRLGDDEFGIRDKASLDLEKLGASAVSLLRKNLKNEDVEIVYRSGKCLEHIEKVAGPAVSMAAARTVAHYKPPGAAQTLIAYLPFADDEGVVEEVGNALAAVAILDGKPDPDVLDALRDKMPLKRAAAAEALIRSGSAELRQTLHKMLKDDDVMVRLRVALALYAHKDLDAVPVMIGLLADMNLGLGEGRQVESLLMELAGDLSPRVTMNQDELNRKKCRDAWAEWWKTFDGPGLLTYIRNQTPTGEERKKIRELIAQLNATPESREKTTKELAGFGLKAGGLLRQAAHDADPKTTLPIHQVLKSLDKELLHDTLSDAARLLALRKPDGTVKALIEYLPDASEESLEEIWTTLALLGVKNDKADPDLLAALKSGEPARRAGAAVALTRAAAADARPAVRNLLKDKDANVRLTVALALAPAGEKDSVPVLIELLAQLPIDRSWQAEHLLFRLAEDKAPSVMLSSEKDSPKKCRDAWAGWWKANSEKVKLAKLEGASRMLGYTLVVTSGGFKRKIDGQVMELGPDGKVRWQFEGALYPMDAHVVSANRVLVAEFSGNKVTERNFKGEVLWTKDIAMPLGCQRLPNGNTFIACRNQIVEVDRTGKEVSTIQRPSHDVMAAQKLRNGHIVMLSSSGILTRYDAAGKELSSVTVGAPQIFGLNIDVLPNGRVLVPQFNSNKIIEYDAEGKSVWEASFERPTSVSRLPNGHTLVSSMFNMQIVELDRTGKQVWKHTADGRVMRVRRR